MIQKLKIALLSAVTLLVLAAPAVVSAQNIGAGLCQGAEINLVGNGAGCVNNSDSTLQDKIKLFINIFSIIVGAIAVIMIIIGGFRYIVSGGRQESVTGAKNTILYALVGLIIVALAQIVVRFILTKTV